MERAPEFAGHIQEISGQHVRVVGVEATAGEEKVRLYGFGRETPIFLGDTSGPRLSTTEIPSCSHVRIRARAFQADSNPPRHMADTVFVDTGRSSRRCVEGGPSSERGRALPPARGTTLPPPTDRR